MKRKPSDATKGYARYDVKSNGVIHTAKYY